MRVLKVAVWGMGLVIIALVGVLFWKVAEIYGEKSETAENTDIPRLEAASATGSVTGDVTAAVTAADAAVPAVKAAPVMATDVTQTLVTTSSGTQVVIDLPGELREISASHGIILLQVRLEKKHWMAISIDQSNGQVLSRVTLNSK